ncbi:MAG: hypothetical protein ACQESR_18895 [Planctomycetota bacterium]
MLAIARSESPFIPVAHDFGRRESDQREDGLRQGAIHPDKVDRLKCKPVAGDFGRRESDQREDGLRQGAFHPDSVDRLKCKPFIVPGLGVLFQRLLLCLSTTDLRFESARFRGLFIILSCSRL